MNYKTCLVVRTVCNMLAILAAVAVLILPRTVFPEGLGVWSHVLLIGAVVLVLAGAEPHQEAAVTLEDAVAQVLTLKAQGIRLKDAAKEVAEHTGFSKNELYAAALEQ